MSKQSVRKFYETFDFKKMLIDSPKLILDFLSGEIAFIEKHFKSNSSILEIGCGYGRLLEILASKSSKLIGIDFSKRMVGLSKQNLSKIQNVSVELMEADRLSFKNESFDYVVCLDGGFGNMPNIELDVLKEMKRTCKKGGEIIVSVFSEDAKEVQKENYGRIGLTGIRDDGEAIHTTEGFYSRRFTREGLMGLFNNIGLKCEIIKICPVNYIAYAIKN